MRPGEHAPVPGNSAVVQMLELWLEEARKGNIGWCALVSAEYPSLKGWGFAGIADLQRLGLEAFGVPLEEIQKSEYGLFGEISSKWRNRTLPTRPDLGADHVVYNLAQAPIGWDFLPWLVDATMTMRREGRPGPLKVKFWFGRDGQIDIGRYRRMFNNVFRPLLPLIGAVEEAGETLGRHKEVYTLRDIVSAVRAGEEVPMLQASEVARELVRNWFPDQRPVTITLREADHWPHRNSNMEAWVRFARDLQMKGERVVFVRDTAKTEDPLYGFTLCPAASVNIDVRMALYERAKCNLLVSNGPCGLCLFAPMPYLYFLANDENDPHPPNKPGAWMRMNGMEDGSLLPWAGPHQRFVWETDSYENLSAAWEEFQPILRRAA